MKNLFMFTLALALFFINTSIAFSQECQADSVVRDWIKERDKLELEIVRAWARGTTIDKIASQIGIVLSNEFYIGTKCRKEDRFLEDNLHILNKEGNLKVENIPGTILERLTGSQILSPLRQIKSLSKIKNPLVLDLDHPRPEVEALYDRIKIKGVR